MDDEIINELVNVLEHHANQARPVDVQCPRCSKDIGQRCVNSAIQIVPWHRARYVRAASQAQARVIVSMGTHMPAPPPPPPPPPPSPPGYPPMITRSGHSSHPSVGGHTHELEPKMYDAIHETWSSTSSGAMYLWYDQHALPPDNRAPAERWQPRCMAVYTGMITPPRGTAPMYNPGRPSAQCELAQSNLHGVGHIAYISNDTYMQWRT